MKQHTIRLKYFYVSQFKTLWPRGGASTGISDKQ